MQKSQINNISTYYHKLSVFYKHLIPLLIDICKLFSCNSKPIHALLASKRCLIALQLINENEEISKLV